MARPPKDKPLDLSQRVNLTVGAIDRLVCPPGKQQAFLRDALAPSLRVRVTAAGAKSFVFEGKLNRKTIRRTIGDVRAWSITQARVEANRLRVLLDAGNDPRELDRQQDAEKAARTAEAVADALTVGEAWAEYLKARRPRWSDRHYRDHTVMSKSGGEPSRNGTGKLTEPGLLVPLLNLRLVDLTSDVVDAWAERESGARPARVRLALRLLKAFTRWAAEQPVYRDRIDPSVATGRRAREAAGRARAKTDHLQREQLAAWFRHVQQIPNPVIAAYLQCLLLTGARSTEMAELRWEDINFRWSGISIRDKVEGGRQIPLTPYVATLIQRLPRRNQWVFSSLRSRSGHIEDPREMHGAACAAAGVEVTLHGLRRSFKSLTEWLEVPVGVVAQIMGHKPSATAEKHYTIRPLDLLRSHHEKIEAWMLEQAGIHFDPKAAAPGGLRVIKGSEA
jgi:integrase